MVNFLRETIESIGETNHSEQDVMFVGSADGEYRVSWDKFKEISNFEYDNGYGGQEVAYDLIVCFKDGSWLERYEYDGSERWYFVGLKNFREDDDYKGFDNVIGDGYWESLRGINKWKLDFYSRLGGLELWYIAYI